jgi:hypothetical protein
VAGMDLELCARYRLGESAAVKRQIDSADHEPSSASSRVNGPIFIVPTLGSAFRSVQELRERRYGR